ncbi:hypothetical protein G6F22_015557 [Rhizopus arrhizus]|nr:hypothetical protein G6F22_015557 [Rhizopus arrhizus]
MTCDTSHGWIKARADGARAKCGGPAICSTCQTEKMHESMLTACFGANQSAVSTPVPQVVSWLSSAARDVLAERQRQMNAEGWPLEHDDSYTDEQLARAAVCYALPQGDYEIPEPPEFWPWDPAWWKPGHRRRELIETAIQKIEELKRQTKVDISAFFPDGAAVEVRLTERQRSWAPAEVLSASWASLGCVRVRPVKPARSGRRLVRDVPYQQVRRTAMGAQQNN